MNKTHSIHITYYAHIEIHSNGMPLAAFHPKEVSMKLKDLYILNNCLKGLKVRFKYWDHSIKYFEIFHYDNRLNKFFGVLDSGEEVSYHAEIMDWRKYYSGDEENNSLAA